MKNEIYKLTFFFNVKIGKFAHFYKVRIKQLMNQNLHISMETVIQKCLKGVSFSRFVVIQITFTYHMPYK